MLLEEVVLKSANTVGEYIGYTKIIMEFLYLIRLDCNHIGQD